MPVGTESTRPLVGVVIGSKTDESLIQPALEILQDFGIEYEFSVISAHRTPAKAREYGIGLSERGIEVIIAGAGAAAHLPGVLASWTTIPVIGVPLATSELKGQDALYSIVQMPSGVPVACVGIGGAKNAALLAAQILGLKYPNINKASEHFREKLRKG
ncbi:MAG: 5-(carboxyamino)imidazole ribonucleotide mutase [Chloroflexota bacterium]|nr:5-(carboxyamino)imidazole ribonucleotide mutase [Chloroflexota bacterium]